MSFGAFKRACVVAAATATVAIAAAPVAGAAASGPVWSPALPYGSGVSTATGGLLPIFLSISCVDARDCVAAGVSLQVGGTGTTQPIVAAESAGIWGPPVPVSSLPVGVDNTKSATLSSISCTDATSCVAVGNYTDKASGGTTPMTVPISVSGSNVTPGNASAVGLPNGAATGSSQAAALTGVSCDRSGDCTAVGSYTVSAGGTLPIVAVGGVAGAAWTSSSVTTAPPVPTTPPTNPDAKLTAISCPGAGACEAVGSRGDSKGDVYPWAVRVSNGVADAGEPVSLPLDFVPSTSSTFLLPGLPTNSLTAISCPSYGVCTAAGSYPIGASSMAPVAVPITAGLPGTPVKLTELGLGTDTLVSGIWCSSASDCSVAGITETSSSSTTLTPLVGNESGGTWSPLAPLTLGSGDAVGYLAGMTCVSADVCTASGFEANSLSGASSSEVNAFFANSAPPLSVSTSSLPAATVGVRYSATLQTTSGSGSSSWSIAPGSLPAGLSLDRSTGVVSGTPTTAGQDGFIANVSDSGPPVQTASAGLSITVSPAPVPTPHLVASVAIAYLTTAGHKAVLVLSCSGAPCSGTVSTDGVEHLKGGTPTAVAATAGRTGGHRHGRHGHAKRKRKQLRTKQITLASGRYSIAAGGTEVVTLNLSRAAIRLLNRLHHVAGYLSVTPAGAGNPALIKKLVFRSATRKAPKAKRHRKRAHRR